MPNKNGRPGSNAGQIPGTHLLLLNCITDHSPSECPVKVTVYDANTGSANNGSINGQRVSSASEK